MISKSQFKYIRQLGQKKYRIRERCFTVEGEKMVTLAFKLGLKVKYCLYTNEIQMAEFPIHEHAQTVFGLISDREMKQLSHFKSPSSHLAVVEMKPQLPFGSIDFEANTKYIFLNDLQDPGNFGTILRAADWFGWSGVITSPNTVEYYNPKVVQSSMGSIYRFTPCTAQLHEIFTKNQGYILLGADTEGIPLNEVCIPPEKSLVLMLGNESKGLDKASLEVCDQVISIEGSEEKIAESLNVAMASAILIHYFSH
jgi:TrmH family RNA methyltransferase